MILGFDIGRNGSAVVCPLLGMPENIAAYYKNPAIEFLKITPCHEDFDRLLYLKPEGMVMEPTGGWYSEVWSRFGEVYDIPVYWVGHADLKAQRIHFNFSNKYDDIDSLTLAATYYDHQWIDEHGQKRWIKDHLIKAVQPIRKLVLEYYQLDKLTTLLTAQIKQRLSYEFPELTQVSWQQDKFDCYNVIKWLAGEKKQALRERQSNESVARRLGIDLTKYTQDHSLLLHSTELRQWQIKAELEEWFKNPIFKPYHRAFKDFEFSSPLKGLILYKTFPFEKFLVNGFPYVTRYQSKSGKWNKKHHSLRQFQAYFGLSRRVEQSGKSTQIKWSGSKLLRSKIFMWCLSRVCSQRSRIKNELGEKLGEKWDNYKETDKAKGKDAITRISFVATRVLFQKLRDEIVF